MTANTPKALMIGLDGTPWNKVKKWTEEGELPFFSSIIENGVYEIMESTIPSNTCPALTTLYTGKNPGNLGIFDFLKPDGSLVSYKDFEGDNLIEQLPREGYKVLFAGARLAYPPPKVNGIVISTVPGLIDANKLVSPPDKANIVKDFFPDENQQENWKSLINNPFRYKKEIIKHNSDMLENKLRVFDRLLKNEVYDFGFLWISETDSSQHYCWRDEGLLLNFFKEVDKQLEDFSQNYHESDIFIVSDHGFGPAAEYNFHLNEWLLREGYLKMRGNPFKRLLVKLGYSLTELYTTDSFAKKILNFLNNFSSSSSKGNENKQKKQDLAILPLDNIPGVDWSKTQAHLTTSKGWGIKIKNENLNRNYEEVREEIIKKLKQLKDSSGNRVVKNAWRGEEIYWGKYEEQVPDIIFLKEDIFKVRPSLVGKLFTKIRKKEENYIGNHDSSREGIFFAFGPDINDNGENMDKVQLYDIAPTILHMYGIPVPEDMDGRVLKEIFKEDSEPGKREVEYRDTGKDKDLISSKVKKLKEKKKL